MVRVKLFSGGGSSELTNLVNEFLEDIPEENVIDIKLNCSSDAEGKRINAYTDILVVYKS